LGFGVARCKRLTARLATILGWEAGKHQIDGRQWWSVAGAAAAASE